jgi:hypothetical protein
MSTSNTASNTASDAAPLPAPHRLIHTHDPLTGAPLLREDTVPINPMGNGDPSAYGMIYVQDQLKADPAKALEGPDKTPDTMWVCSTGVTSAWIGECASGLGGGSSDAVGGCSTRSAVKTRLFCSASVRGTRVRCGVPMSRRADSRRPPA